MSCIESILGPRFLAPPQQESQAQQEETLAQISPPALIPPSALPPSSEYCLVHLIDQLCQTKNRFLHSQANRLSAMQEKLQEATEELTRRLTELTEAAKNATYWSSVKKMATSLASALSLVAGLTLVGTSGMALVGAALITSGVLSITHLVMNETKGWDKLATAIAGENGSRKQQLRQILPIACATLAAACSLAGSGYAIASDALSLGEQAGAIVQTTFTLFQSGVLFKQGMSESQLRQAQGQMTTAESCQELSSKTLELCSEQFQALYSHFEHMMKQARRAVACIVKTHHTPVS